jgi:hypothetical protein
VDARLVRRHPDDAEERLERHLATRLVAANACLCVELPRQGGGLAVDDPETLVER